MESRACNIGGNCAGILVLICLPERLDMPRRLRIMTQFGCTQIHIGIIIGISQNKEWVKKIN